MACGCSNSGKSDLSSLSGRAMKLAMAIPDEYTCRKAFGDKEAEFLSALRNVAVDLSFAHKWSESEARARFDALRLVDAALDYDFGAETGSSKRSAARMNTGGGTGVGGSACYRCKTEHDDCVNDCDVDPDAGFTCYWDCRVAYYACIAGCIIRGNSHGLVIA
jgi:hypothetical protein